MYHESMFLFWVFLVPILLFNAKKNNNYKYHLKTCTILIKYNQSDFLFVINNKHIISYRTTVIFSTHGYWIAYDFTHPAERCPHYINEKCKCACFKISLLKRPENGRDTYIYVSISRVYFCLKLSMAFISLRVRIT